jgi:site-specific DNA recombinase
LVTVADFYGRKSNKDEGRSVAGQESDFHDDCATEGLTPGRVFADPDRSASRYAKKPRPDYLALLEHINSGKCEMLSMWESSRGGRDLGPWVHLLDLCRAKGVLIRIISHGRTYDIRVRRDWRTLAEEGIDSADESEKISERVRRGKRQSAAQGLRTARLAFGFRRIYDERGKFVEQVPHPEQAPIVREIIDGLADGKTAGAIAKSLNARGIPTPQRVCADACTADHKHYRGGTWKDSQVRAIAIKPSYAGLRVHQGTVVGDGQWSPLVDPAKWRKVHARLTTPGSHAVTDTRLAHWLTGAVFCGNCGGPFAMGHRHASSNNAYRCRSCFRVTASAPQLEAFIEPLIIDRLSRQDVLDLFAPQDDPAALDEATAELEELNRRLREFHEEGAKPNGLSAAAVAAAERGLQPQINAAEQKIKRMTLRSSLPDLDIDDVAGSWARFQVKVKRDTVLKLAHLVLRPGDRSGRKVFDPARLAGSRWTGDDRTWGEIWGAA